MTQPASVPTNGTTGAVWIEAVADIDAPELDEVTALTSLDISCYVVGDGLNPETSENNIEDPRLCSKQVFEQPGDFTDTLELTYTFNPASPLDNEASLTLQPGAEAYVSLRWGVDSDQPYAAADIVDMYQVTAGQQRKQSPGRNGIHRIMQKLFVTGRVARDVAIVDTP
jgi:hypothetical protein